MREQHIFECNQRMPSRGQTAAKCMSRHVLFVVLLVFPLGTGQGASAVHDIAAEADVCRQPRIHVLYPSDGARLDVMPDAVEADINVHYEVRVRWRFSYLNSDVLSCLFACNGTPHATTCSPRYLENDL